LSFAVTEANKRVLAGLTAMGPTYKSMLTKIEALLLQNPRPVASEPFGSFESQVAYAAASADMQQVMQTADFWSSNFSSGGVCEEPNAIVAVVRVVCQSVSANIDPCIVTLAADLNDALLAKISDESGSRRTTFPDLVSMHGKYVELARVFRNSHDTVAWLLQMRALHVTKLLGTAASLLTTCVEQNPGEIADQVADLSGIAKAVSERLEFAANLGQQCFDSLALADAACDKHGDFETMWLKYVSRAHEVILPKAQLRDEVAWTQFDQDTKRKGMHKKVPDIKAALESFGVDVSGTSMNKTQLVNLWSQKLMEREKLHEAKLSEEWGACVQSVAALSCGGIGIATDDCAWLHGAVAEESGKFYSQMVQAHPSGGAFTTGDKMEIILQHALAKLNEYMVLRVASEEYGDAKADLIWRMIPKQAGDGRSSSSSLANPKLFVEVKGNSVEKLHEVKLRFHGRVLSGIHASGDDIAGTKVPLGSLNVGKRTHFLWLLAPPPRPGGVQSKTLPMAWFVKATKLNAWGDHHESLAAVNMHIKRDDLPLSAADLSPPCASAWSDVLIDDIRVSQPYLQYTHVDLLDIAKNKIVDADTKCNA